MKPPSKTQRPKQSMTPQPKGMEWGKWLLIIGGLSIVTYVAMALWYVANP